MTPACREPLDADGNWRVEYGGLVLVARANEVGVLFYGEGNAAGAEFAPAAPRVDSSVGGDA